MLIAKRAGAYCRSKNAARLNLSRTAAFQPRVGWQRSRWISLNGLAWAKVQPSTNRITVIKRSSVTTAPLRQSPRKTRRHLRAAPPNGVSAPAEKQ